MFVWVPPPQLTDASEFRTQTRALHDNIVDRWRKFTVSRIVGEYHLALRLVSKHKASGMCLQDSR